MDAVGWINGDVELYWAIGFTKMKMLASYVLELLRIC